MGKQPLAASQAPTAVNRRNVARQKSMRERLLRPITSLPEKASCNQTEVGLTLLASIESHETPTPPPRRPFRIRRQGFRQNRPAHGRFGRRRAEDHSPLCSAEAAGCAAVGGAGHAGAAAGPGAGAQGFRHLLRGRAEGGRAGAGG